MILNSSEYPPEVTEMYSDLPHAVYEWVMNCHGWIPAYWYYLARV